MTLECYRRRHCSREHRPNRYEFHMYHSKGNRGVRRDRKWSRYRERMARRHVRMPSSSQTSPVWRGGCRRGYRRYYYRSKQSRYKRSMSEGLKYFPFGLEDVFPSSTWTISIGMQAPIGCLVLWTMVMLRRLIHWVFVIFLNVYCIRWVTILLGLWNGVMEKVFDRDKCWCYQDEWFYEDEGANHSLSFGPEFSSDNAGDGPPKQGGGSKRQRGDEEKEEKEEKEQGGKKSKELKDREKKERKTKEDKKVRSDEKRKEETIQLKEVNKKMEKDLNKKREADRLRQETRRERRKELETQQEKEIRLAMERNKKAEQRALQLQNETAQEKADRLAKQAAKKLKQRLNESDADYQARVSKDREQHTAR